MEIYTTGGGYFVEQILVFLALFHASNDFDVMMLIAIVAGISATAVILLFGMTFQKFLQNFIMMMLAGSFMLGGTVSVDVHDKTYGTLSYYSTVDNVPRGVAYLAHYTTGVSYYITEKMEQLLSTPTDLAYQKNGISFGASLMAQQARWRAINSVTNERMVEFMQKCMVRSINLGYIPTDVIARATDIDAAVAANLPASLSFFDNKTGTVQPCATGWADIQIDVNAEVSEVLKHQAASAYQRNPGVDGAATVANLTNTLTAFQNYVGASSATATNTVKQAMLVNAFDDSLHRYASLSGNDASLTNLTNSIADAQRRGANISVGLMAGKTVPYLKIIFECIYYGLFPIAAMLLFTPMCWSIIKGYCGGFIWLAMWEPASAILHGIVLWAASGFYRDVGIQTSDGQPTDVAMTWANHFGFIAVEQDVGAFAGSMMIMVPFITTAIFYGARSMTQLATSMLNVGQGIAQEAGRTAATGNVSLANTSMNNMTANKWTTASTVDAGRWQAVSPTGAIIGQNADLSNYHASGTATPNVTMSLSGRQALSTELSERADASRTAAATTSSELSNYLTEGVSQYSALMSSASQSASVGHQRTTGLSQEDSTNLREAQRVIDSVASNEGINSELFLRAGLAANVGMNKGDFLNSQENWKGPGSMDVAEGRSKNRSVGGGVNGSAGMSANSTENYSRAWDAAQSEEVQRALATVERIGQNSTVGSTGSYGDSANEGERFTLDEGRRMAATLAHQFREADAYSRAAADVENRSVASDTQLGIFVQRALEDQKLSRQQVSDILTARDFGALAQQEAILEEVISDMMGHYGIGNSVTDTTLTFTPTSYYNPGSVSRDLPSTVAPMQEGIAGEAGRANTQMNETADRFENGQGVVKEGFDQHYNANKARNDAGMERSLRETNQARTRDVGRQLRDGLLGDAPAPAEPGLGSPMPILPGEHLLPPAPPPALTWTPGGFQTGFYQAPNISYDLNNKVRGLPPQPELMQNISGYAAELGPDVGVVVRSAGQPSFGSNRVGSPRHDHGNAVDIQLTKGGEPVSPSDNPALYAAFIERAAADNTGIGHYDWGLHVGGGPAAFWGPDKTSASADSAFRAAYERGRGS